MSLKVLVLGMSEEGLCLFKDLPNLDFETLGADFYENPSEVPGQMTGYDRIVVGDEMDAVARGNEKLRKIVPIALVSERAYRSSGGGPNASFGCSVFSTEQWSPTSFSYFMRNGRER